MIEALIGVVILFIVVMVLAWLVRYFEGPEIIVKVIIGLAVLVALLIILEGFGVNTGVHWRGNWRN